MYLNHPCYDISYFTQFSNFLSTAEVVAFKEPMEDRVKTKWERGFSHSVCVYFTHACTHTQTHFSEEWCEISMPGL